MLNKKTIMKLVEAVYPILKEFCRNNKFKPPGKRLLIELVTELLAEVIEES